jgi:hypothetical protein
MMISNQQMIHRNTTKQHIISNENSKFHLNDKIFTGHLNLEETLSCIEQSGVLHDSSYHHNTMLLKDNAGLAIGSSLDIRYKACDNGSDLVCFYNDDSLNLLPFLSRDIHQRHGPGSMNSISHLMIIPLDLTSLLREGSLRHILYLSKNNLSSIITLVVELSNHTLWFGEVNMPIIAPSDLIKTVAIQWKRVSVSLSPMPRVMILPLATGTRNTQRSFAVPVTYYCVALVRMFVIVAALFL